MKRETKLAAKGTYIGWVQRWARPDRRRQLARRAARVAAVGVAVGAIAGAMEGCSGPPLNGGVGGNLEVFANGNLSFASATGFAQSFFSTDYALGPTPLLSLSSNSMVVHYSDNFSTINSQEEVLVLARDPIEYRTTLEAIYGPIGFLNDAAAQWATQTLSCGDTWNVRGVEPDGVTLPFAMTYPFPDGNTPATTDWPLTQGAFAGTGAAPCGSFAGAAATSGGSIKGISVIRHGVCSREQGLQNQLQGLQTSFKLSQNFGLASYQVFDMGLASFVSYAPTGGVVMEMRVHAAQAIPFPPFATSQDFDRNVTFFFGLDDGIFSVGAPTFNISVNSGFDLYNIAHTLDSKLEIDGPDSIKIAALDGPVATFKGGQAQPIPGPGAPAASNVCSQLNAQRPSVCFNPCGDSDTVKMLDPSTWPSPQNPGDPSSVDPATWHDTHFCSHVVTALDFAFGVGAGTDPNLDGNAVASLEGTLDESLNGDATKYHNLRCNFYPKYEAGTNGSTDPLTGKPITTGPPVCELIVRAKRLNVFPDRAEAVFFDGPDLVNVPATESANEAFAVYLTLKGLPNGAGASAIGQLCQRGSDAPMQRAFAHSLYSL